MRKGTVLSLKNLRPVFFIAENKVLIILVFMLIIGIAFGTFSEARLSILSDYSDNFIERFINIRTKASFFSVVVNSFMTVSISLLIIFAAGTSLTGLVLVPVFVAFKGVLYGAVTAFLYSEFTVKGIAFNAVFLIPATAVFIIALLLAARESMNFSVIIAKLSLPNGITSNLSYDFKKYCGRYLIICLIAVVSAVIDAMLSCSFMSSLTL